MRPKFAINPTVIPVAVAAAMFLSASLSWTLRVPTYAETIGAVASAAKAGSIVRAEFEIDGISCYGTSKTFAKWVKELPGIASVTTYTSTRSAEITYDRTLVGPDEMIMKIEREISDGVKMIKPFSVVRYRGEPGAEWTVLRNNKAREVDEL